MTLSSEPSADLLEFHPRFRRKARCSYCTGPMRKRMASNDPAYCTYECGCNAQPDKIKAVLSTTRGQNAK